MEYISVKILKCKSFITQLLYCIKDKLSSVQNQINPYLTLISLIIILQKVNIHSCQDNTIRHGNSIRNAKAIRDNKSPLFFVGESISNAIEE